MSSPPSFEFSMNGKFSRDASGRATFDAGDVPVQDYKKIRNYVARRFRLQQHGNAVQGLDEVFQDFRSGDAIIGIEWDCWSGFILVAKTAQAEPLIEAIGNHLNAIKTGNEFEPADRGEPPQ